MTLGVVIPVYRGFATVGSVVESLSRFAKSRKILCRAVLVEDGCGDESRAEVLRVAALHPGVTAVLMAENTGQQRALYTGLSFLQGCDLIATMDDDGSHPVSLLDALMQAVAQGADICYGVPRRRGYTLWRKAGARMRDAFFALCTAKPKGVKVSAYRVMTGALAQRLLPEEDGFIYLSAAAFRLRPKAACVSFLAGSSGASGYSFHKLLALYMEPLMHYTPMKALRRHKCPKTFAYSVYPGKGFLWEP